MYVCLRKGVASFFENIGRIKHSKPFEMLYTIGGVVWRHTHTHTLGLAISLVFLTSLSPSRSRSSQLNWDIFTLKLCSLRHFYVFNWKNENRRARESSSERPTKKSINKKRPPKISIQLNTTNKTKHSREKREEYPFKQYTKGHWLSGFVCFLLSSLILHTHRENRNNSKNRTHMNAERCMAKIIYEYYVHSERHNVLGGRDEEGEREGRRKTTKNISFCCRFQL